MAGRATGFLELEYNGPRAAGARYALFVPHGYDGAAEYPAIVFLHGAGETGNDGLKPVRVGLGPAIKKREVEFPFITIFPQSRSGTWRAGTGDADRALRILDQVQRTYRIDFLRISLTGISMGGYGTWSLAEHYPDLWASIVPVCGGGDPERAERIKHIPCWCFHGEADDVIPADESRKMIRALRAAGGNPRYDEYPGVGHNSWDAAYATPELYDWLLTQHR